MTFLDKLSSKIRSHKEKKSDDSYVASLHKAGLNKILEKVGEESIELIIAAKEGDQPKNKKELVKETADLWFHCLVLLDQFNLSASEVLDELEARADKSGHQEKRERGPK